MTLLDAPAPAATRGRALRPDAPAPVAAPARPRVAAYDGIRAVSIIAVLLFHADVPGATGGFLGVSVFFTLSGFLITGLLVGEYQGSRRIGLGRFWERRFRRLLPAAAATIAVVMVLAPHLIGYSYKNLTPDAAAATLNVANWHQLFARQSYSQVLNPGSASPLIHFWSLAIEEQFYLVFPLLAAIALHVGGVRGLRRAIVALTAGSLVTIAFCTSFNAVYYNTGARAAEILLGGLLAVLVAERPGGFLAGGHPRFPVPFHVAVRTFFGLVALGVLVWGTHALAVDDPIFEKGFLPAFAVASCLLVIAASGPGPISSVLGISPLRWLGERSYGIYLIHWPIFLVIRHEQPTWPPLAVLAAGTAIACALASLSFRHFEMPIRRWQPPGHGADQLAMRIALPIVILTLTLTTVVTHPFAPAPVTTFDQRIAADLDIAPPAVTGPPEAVSVAVFGDSTAGYMELGLGQWATASGLAQLHGGSADAIGLGCPVALGGRYRYLGTNAPVPAGCDWHTNWPAFAAEFPAKVAVVQYGLIDVADRTLPGDDRTFHHFGDPDYDDYVRAQVREAALLLNAHGYKVVWIAPPPVNVAAAVTGAKPTSKDAFSASDPFRMARFDEIIDGVASELPGMASIDLATYLQSLPGGLMDPAIRPDGIHFTPASAAAVSQGYLGQAILRAAATIPDSAVTPAPVAPTAPSTTSTTPTTLP